ncbi:O-antigen ligase family protein [Parapedobacter tibetensis]|uniref:O-antigen ligase family protein n=1 Tax=Parapedobacter tibetensis TaxID=2972951 RepID=UPI00214D395A|nr:O-antigen ligase family protein [Parapedobacter tibetensis]
MESIRNIKRDSVIWLSLTGLLGIAIAFLVAFNGALPILVILSCIFVMYAIVVYHKPIIGLYTLTGYCFMFGLFGREFSSIPFGIGIEFLGIFTLSIVLVQYQRFNWNRLNCSLFWLYVCWFILSLLQLFNPSGPSFMGWLQEFRSVALNPLIIIVLSLLLFESKKELRTFVILVLFFGFLAVLNGIKQKHFGLFPGEQLFAETSPTHMIWGRLRVFSFFSDAGQFGAAQAVLAVAAVVLALGPFNFFKKLVFFMLCGLFLYGMLISGTRGALFALFIGGFFAVLLSKNYKILVSGILAGALCFGMLKYTTVGNGNYEIMRIRSALDPNEASLNVRLENQKILRAYLADKPFGEGLGVIGFWGHEYNADKFLSTIEPDSYWVKIWAMYGITGFVFWFCMMMYLFGKAGGMIFNIKETALKVKLVSLLSMAMGLFVCSYGNEVMNAMPSSLIFFTALSWGFLIPHITDKESVQP